MSRRLLLWILCVLFLFPGAIAFAEDVLANLPARMEALAREADAAGKGITRLKLVMQAMPLGDACIAKHPQNAACYYFRAMATGFYYEMKIIGYQKGVVQMIADCQKAITLQPNIDHAGPYRTIGELYTQLPKSTIHPGGVTRNLPEAKRYLTEAVHRAPEFPENHIALCEALLESGDRAAAQPHCATGEQLAQRWPTAYERTTWLANVAKLKKRLAK